LLRVGVALHIKTLSRISWLAACETPLNVPMLLGDPLQTREEKKLFFEICITFYFI
jgi:hypothetical protein